MKTFYECGYGGNASIQTKSDGTAVLRMFAGGKTERRTCKSVTSAKTVAFALDGWALQRGEEPC